jgi:hypothetical protein
MIWEPYGAMPTNHSALYKSEDIVQDVEAAVSWHELEHLGEVHWSLLFVDLCHVSALDTLAIHMRGRTRSAPVIKTMIPPWLPDGCASCVETACLTLVKERLWSFSRIAVVPW